MAVALHDTVGLLHATMALFNAWVDRVPILAVVGTVCAVAPTAKPAVRIAHAAMLRLASIVIIYRFPNSLSEHLSLSHI